MSRHHIDYESLRRSKFFAARSYIRSLISYKQATDLGDIFAYYTPSKVQRFVEKRFDFPIADIIRSSNILLIRIPKTASVSLALQIYGQVSHIPHRTATFYRDADAEFFENSISFAVMRDPVDRAVSAYNWLRSRGSQFAAPDKYGHDLVEGINSFEQFVLEILEPASSADRLRHLDPVLHRQCDYICDTEGNVIVDHVFMINKMTDVYDFLVRHGIDGVQYHENKTESNIITKDIAVSITKIIEKVYLQDYKLIEIYDI